MDFLNNESYELIKEIIMLKKERNIDIEIIAYNHSHSDDINNAYYGYEYANNYGVGLEFLEILLRKHYIDSLDIGNSEIVADAFAELGYVRDNMIDAIIEGDYQDMHEFKQYRIKHDNVDSSIYALSYDDNNNKEVIIGKENILKTLNK
jgi:predicted DsbA family dithiol-disulfide isomerase